MRRSLVRDTLASCKARTVPQSCRSRPSPAGVPSVRPFAACLTAGVCRRSRSGIVAAAACLITGSTRVRRSSVQRASAVAVGHTPVHGRAERVGRLLHLLRRLQLQGHAHRAHARLPAGRRQRWATSGRAALCDAGSSRGLTGCEATRRGLVRAWQALWQQSTASTAIGELEGSSLLLDEVKSQLHVLVEQWITSKQLNTSAINMLEAKPPPPSPLVDPCQCYSLYCTPLGALSAFPCGPALTSFKHCRGFQWYLLTAMATPRTARTLPAGARQP